MLFEIQLLNIYLPTVRNELVNLWHIVERKGTQINYSALLFYN